MWTYLDKWFLFSSVAQSCPILCDPTNHSTPGLPVHHQLHEFTQTHVQWVGDAWPSKLIDSSLALPILWMRPSRHFFFLFHRGGVVLISSIFFWFFLWVFTSMCTLYVYFCILLISSGFWSCPWPSGLTCSAWSKVAVYHGASGFWWLQKSHRLFIFKELYVIRIGVMSI